MLVVCENLVVCICGGGGGGGSTSVLLSGVCGDAPPPLFVRISQEFG